MSTKLPMPTTQTISAGQFALMVTAAYLGFGIFQFPLELVKDGGPDALYSLILEILAAFGGLWLLFRANRIQPGETMTGFSHQVLHPMIRWPISVITIAIHSALGACLVSNFGFVITAFFLPDTPDWVIRLTLVATCLYMVWFDTPSLARTVQILLPMTMLLTLLMGLLLVPKMTSGYAVIPSASIHVLPILYAAYRDFYVFLGFEVSVTLYPYIRPPERALGEKYTFLAMGVVGAWFIIGYALVLGVEGPYFMVHLLWPPVSAMRLINVSGFIINKLGLLVIVMWGVFTLLFIAVRIWCVGHDVMPLFRLTSRTAYRLLAGGGAVVIYLGASLFPTVHALVQWFATYLLPTAIAYIFLVPLIVMLGAWLTKRKHQKSKASPANPQSSPQ